MGAYYTDFWLLGNGLKGYLWLKFEIRSTKLETKSNDSNFKYLHILQFKFVSDFGFRASDFY